MDLIRFAAGAALALSAVAAAAEDLPFSDPRWKIEGPGVRRERFEDRDVLAMDTGLARLPDLGLQDGTIEFDVKLTRRRSFVYLIFRTQAEGEQEEIYLRPHKSALPDAVQYTPSFQGQAAWQLFHGPGATAAVEFATDRFTHVRVVLRGSRAALFLGEAKEPALVVPKLARPPQPGGIALRSFVPRGTAAGEPAARFANVKVGPGVVGYDFGPEPAPAEPAKGSVRAWAVSQSFAQAAKDDVRMPAASTLGALTRVESEPSGRVLLHRYAKMPAGDADFVVAARVHVRAGQAGTRAFSLGFSDRAVVFLNGVPLFQGEGSYSFDAPRREGLLGYDQATVMLPLRAGDNELVVVIRDVFGGAGLMGRFDDPAGLEVDAR
jgi:hypothetical protein